MEESVLNEISKAISEGPSFAQSSFQTNKFTIDSHGTPGRAYRQVLMALDEKVTALKKARIGVKITLAKIEKMRKKLEETIGEEDREILSCKIELKKIDLETTNKLVKDAIKDCNELYTKFKTIPHVSDEEFEKQELEYWTKRLSLDAELSILATGRIDNGIAMSLLNIGINPVKAQLELSTQLDNNLKLIENK